MDTFSATKDGREVRHGYPAMLALLFAVSAAATVDGCMAMAAMGDMPMPGGWTMSMAWMRMPGQTWFGATASFLGMWIAMMVAMMLPPLLPMLRRYREAIDSGGAASPDWLTLRVGTAYFLVWAAFGLAVYPLGVALAAADMHWAALARAVPFVMGVIVLTAGAFQFTAWKAHALACCRGMPGCDHSLPADPAAAWRHGLRLGLHCSECCANWMVVLLVAGLMDLRAMAAVTLAIALERLAPNGVRVARVTGSIVVATGLLLLTQAA